MDGEVFFGPPGDTNHATFRGEDKKHLFIYRGFFGSKGQKNRNFSNVTKRNTEFYFMFYKNISLIMRKIQRKIKTYHQKGEIRKL